MNVQNSIIRNSAKVETTQVGSSADGWKNKMWDIHTMEYYSVIRKKMKS